jgi:hypothetical protein
MAFSFSSYSPAVPPLLAIVEFAAVDGMKGFLAVNQKNW